MSEMPYSPEPTSKGDYSYQVALKKVAWALTKGLIAFLSGPKVMSYLNGHGLTLTLDPNIISGTIFGLLVYVHDYLKVHTQYKWL